MKFAVLALAVLLLCGCSTSGVSHRTVSPEGTWILSEDNSAFLQVFPNGQCVRSAEGTFRCGYWRRSAKGLIALFEDGRSLSMDRLAGNARWSEDLEFRSGRRSARRITGPETERVGVWRLSSAPDTRFLAILPDGQTRDSANPDQAGRWKRSDGGVICESADGWRDVLVAAADSHRYRSFPPGMPIDASPVDMGVTWRVGEKPFQFASASRDSE